MAVDPIEFIKYDKFSDDVYNLGPNVMLKFNVSLSRTDQNGKRYYFYKEFEYNSRCQDPQTLITVKRTFDYYLSIENVQKNRTTDDKAFIRIGPQDYFKFLNQLEETLRWFDTKDKKYKSLFARAGGKIILCSPIPESVSSGYPQNKFIRMVPVVIDKGEGADRIERGVEMDLSSYDNYVIMNYDRLRGLYYCISRFNMYESAQNLVNYLGIPGGTHRFDMAKTSGRGLLASEDFTGEIEGVNDRVIGSKKNISALE